MKKIKHEIKTFKMNENYKLFFKDFGFTIPRVRMVINPKRKVGGEYYLVKKTIELAPNPSEFTMIHELVHTLQLKGVKNTSRVSKISSILEEGGAEFITEIYTLSKSSRFGKGRYSDANTIIKDIQGETAYGIKKIGKNISINSINGWISAFYKSLKGKDKPIKVIRELIADDYKRHSFNKYLIATSFSLLVFSCNKFDVKKTITDLIKVYPPERLTEKVAKAIRTDKENKILDSIIRLSR